MRPARVQQAKLNRRLAGNSERQYPFRLQPVGGSRESLCRVGEVLQHVPHRDHPRPRQALQRANRIVAANRPHAAAIRHIPTAPVVHLDRRYLEAGACRGCREPARTRADLDEPAGVDVAQQELYARALDALPELVSASRARPRGESRSSSRGNSSRGPAVCWSKRPWRTWCSGHRRSGRRASRGCDRARREPADRRRRTSGSGSRQTRRQPSGGERAERLAGSRGKDAGRTRGPHRQKVSQPPGRISRHQNSRRRMC